MLFPLLSYWIAGNRRKGPFGTGPGTRRAPATAVVWYLRVKVPASIDAMPGHCGVSSQEQSFFVSSRRIRPIIWQTRLI